MDYSKAANDEFLRKRIREILNEYIDTQMHPQYLNNCKLKQIKAGRMNANTNATTNKKLDKEEQILDDIILNTDISSFTNAEKKEFNKLTNVIKKYRAEKKKKIKNPSKYNIFMSKELKKIKNNHPGISQTDAMKMAASNWNKIK